MRYMILVASLVLASCSAQWHLNKALKKDPGIIKSDTIVKIDTVYRTIEKIDTVVSIKEIPELDTLEIIKYITKQGRTDTVKIYLNKKGDNLNVGVDCPDCPEITKEILIEKGYIQKPTFWQNLWKYLLGAVIGLVIGFLGFAFILSRGL